MIGADATAAVVNSEDDLAGGLDFSNAGSGADVGLGPGQREGDAASTIGVFDNRDRAMDAHSRKMEQDGNSF